MGSLGVRLTAIGDRLRVHASKGKLPTDLRAQIAERKAEILAYLGERSPANRSIPPRIHPRATDAPAPLSFAQERLWFLEQLEPQSAVYNICRAVRIGGNLNVSAIEAALNEIIRRHQTLRTAFRPVDGQAVQIVQPSGHLAIATIDLRSLSEGDRDVEIKRLIKTAAERPFDLHGGSLLRCTLLRVADGEHILILVTHHAASDAWSMGILTRELWTLYQTYCQDKSSPLDPLAVQYSDYAVWQRDWLQGEVLEAQLSYWKEQLKELPILNLPTDRSRKPRQSFSGARIRITLPAELTTAINELSHRHGVTPFMTLLAAFQVLLYRYSGQEDFALGSPIANRRRPEIEGLIGFFVNTLVLRADLSGNSSFGEVLSRVKDTCIGANANQDLPFEKLVQELQPKRDQSRNLLFQVMFVLQNATQPFSGIPGLRIEPVEIEATRSPFDLSLFLREREGRYIGFFEYSIDLFNRDRIERMVGHFQTLLEAAVANPEQPVTTLPILTEAECRQILVEWNDTAADYPKDKCIHQLFEEQVERTPEAIAVEFEDQRITYAELNRRANQLAHYLINLSIGPEKLVGICVERSIEMVVGLLGILKVGGAYVPLDPSYPKERLRFMMEDSQVSVLLTQARVLEDREWIMEDRGDPEISKDGYSGFEHRNPQCSSLDPRLKVICLDRDCPVIAQQKNKNPEQPVKSKNLAYVIYTSGSTGKPKGVQIEHRSVINCLHSLEKQLGFTERDILLAVTTTSFDISLLELFLPFFVGGKVFIASRDQAADGTELASLLAKSRITALQATPSTWRLLLDTNWEGSPGFKILCGGEAMPRELAEALLTRGEVWNLYGPTESTIWSTVHKVEPGGGPVLIGRSLANTRIYILDSHYQPVPIGVHGDFYIGGDGLARGYWNNPELTTERFIPDPFSDKADARLYRTGDRARYRPDGSIEFLGRTDNQVKIRGHRIELGEIESALMQHPAVKEAVVVSFDEFARDSENAQPVLSRAEGSKIENPKSLVAYVVSQDQPEPTVSELRQFLQSKLPDYMIPTLFLFLDALPLTSNGKLDRSALPPTDGDRPILDRGFVEPRTEIEELVAQVWREVLRREKVGIHDNFFDLGGHSLLATQLLANLHNTFHFEISVRTLFEAPTVRTLALKLQADSNEKNTSQILPIMSLPSRERLPLSYSQEDIWYLEQSIPEYCNFNIPFTYALSGYIDTDKLVASLSEILRRHEILRTVFATFNGRPIQVISETGELDFEIVDIRSSTTGGMQAASELILHEKRNLFNLGTGPLIRFKLLRLTETDSLLLVTLHHIICDQWSVNVLRNEINLVYRAFSCGQPSPLPDVTIQFADFAAWERKVTDTSFMTEQLSYWRRQLSNIPTTDNPSVHLNFRTARRSVYIRSDILAGVYTVARAATCTPFTVLFAALCLTLWRATGRSDIRIATLIANRRRPETEFTVGNFVNTVILRLIVHPDMKLPELLAHAKRVVLDAYNNQEFPFANLIANLDNDHRTNPASLIDIMLLYQNAIFSAPIPDGLGFAPINLKHIALDDGITVTASNLILDLVESAIGLTGCLIHKTAVFDDKAVTNLIKQFELTISMIISEPTRTVSAM